MTFKVAWVLDGAPCSGTDAVVLPSGVRIAMDVCLDRVDGHQVEHHGLDHAHG